MQLRDPVGVTQEIAGAFGVTARVRRAELSWRRAIDPAANGVHQSAAGSPRLLDQADARCAHSAARSRGLIIPAGGPDTMPRPMPREQKEWPLR